MHEQEIRARIPGALDGSLAYIHRAATFTMSSLVST